MKINKFIKKNKRTLAVVSVLVAAGLIGGGYYLASRDNPVPETINTNTEAVTTTDNQVQQNIESKSAATTGESTTTPSAVAETPAISSLSDVSLTILRASDMKQAYVYFYGPAGTYGVEKQVSGSWTTLVQQFSYSGRGGYGFDTVTSAETDIHYRVYRLEGGSKVATSGDTAVTWQQILSSNDGTLSVPLAE